MNRFPAIVTLVSLALVCLLATADAPAPKARKKKVEPANSPAVKDARNEMLAVSPEVKDEGFDQYAIYEQTAPQPGPATPVETNLPLKLNKGDRIALIGNTLFERSQEFGHFEAFLHKRFPDHQLIVRHLAWAADEMDLQPRPANFASTDQHLLHEKVDVIFAAFGFNESFAGEEGLEKFKQTARTYIAALKAKAFNGKTAPRIVIVAPIANENVPGVNAADLNNARIKLYAEALQQIAREQKVACVNVFEATNEAMQSPGDELTINGVHLTENGDRLFSEQLFKAAFQVAASGR